MVAFNKLKGKCPQCDGLTRLHRLEALLLQRCPPVGIKGASEPTRNAPVSMAKYGASRQ